MAEHAKLSPSSAERWMVCTPSVVASEHVENKSSSYADEGTLAHSIGDLELNRGLKRITEAKYKTLLAPLLKSVYYTASLHSYAKDYADYCLQMYAGVLIGDKNAIIHVENRIDLSKYIPEGFGRCDCFIVALDTLITIDFKFGAGMFVAAQENVQQKIYALGVLEEVGYLYDIKRVVLHIYQPRMDNINRWGISAAELVQWGETELSEKAKLAFAGVGDFVPGEHCTFCKIKPKCKAWASLFVDLENTIKAEEDFKNIDTLSDSEILEILTRAPGVVSWIKSLTESTYQKAMDGEILEGLKLIEGNKVRFIKTEDEPKVVTAVLDAFVELTENDLRVTKLLGITELEKRVGKKDFNLYAGDFISEKKQNPKLVPLAAKGTPYVADSSAQKDFENFNPDEL